MLFYHLRISIEFWTMILHELCPSFLYTQKIPRGLQRVAEDDSKYENVRKIIRHSCVKSTTMLYKFHRALEDIKGFSKAQEGSSRPL